MKRFKEGVKEAWNLNYISQVRREGSIFKDISRRFGVSFIFQIEGYPKC